jgi:hypothetical protein
VLRHTLTRRCRNLTFELPPRGVAALLLNDAGAEPESLNGTCALYYQCSVREAGLTYEAQIDLLTLMRFSGRMALTFRTDDSNGSDHQGG